MRGTEPQPFDEVRRPGWGDLSAAAGRLRPKRLVPAAVLVPVIERAEGLSLLLTQRSAHLKHHAGQISFPGGRLEPGDADARAAALRETEEEVGIGADSIDVVGYLDNYFTITGYSVTPVVGLVDGSQALRLDPAEVEEAFEVPVGHALDPGQHRQRQKTIAGIEIPIYEILWERHRIWGATAAMIVAFYDTLFRQG